MFSLFCHQKLRVAQSRNALAKLVSITPIPLWNNEEWRCRYVFGYSLDDSDKPVFLVWPERTENNGFWILDVDRDHYHNLCQVPSIQNLGLELFYAAFGLGCSRNLRTSSARALGISEDNISENCSISRTCYSRCSMAYPAKRIFRRKQKILCRKWRCNLLWRKWKKVAPMALRPLPAPCSWR